MQRLLRLAVLRWGYSIALHHHDISGVRTIWDPCAGGHDRCLRRCDEHCAFCGNGACGSQCAGINRRVGVRFHPCHSGRHIYNNRRFGSSRNAPQSLPAHGRLPIKTRREGGGRGKTSGMAEFLEPIFPILVSYFINMAIVSIAAESVYGEPNAEEVGLTDFCIYFQYLKSGCVLWGIALLAAGQSSAITTTYTGQFVMEGFLDITLPTWARAVLTRLVAITPCIIVSVLFPQDLNLLVNIVNSALSLLLPFAFTPLVKYTTSEKFMGKYAPPVWERWLLRGLAFGVYLLNAIAISAPGGGFFGFVFEEEELSFRNAICFFCMLVLQVFLLWWQATTALTPISTTMMPLEQERVYEKGDFAEADPLKRSLEMTEQEEEHLDPLTGDEVFSIDDEDDTEFRTTGTIT